MSTEKKSWFQKYWKDLMLVASAAFAVFYVCVFAGVWGDRNYKSDFWPDFFKWSAIIIGVAIVGGWVYGWTTQNRKK
jgi:hypothetical protein